MSIRLGRTMGLLAIFAGLTTWFATRAAMKQRDEWRRSEENDRLRWESEGGATTAGPQTPSAEL